MKRSLGAMALGTFALGITEFGMMGILGDVARSMDVGIATAGHLISAYSAGVAVGAPLLIVLRRMPLKNLMLLLAATIFAGNMAAALSPNYIALLCARFVSGLPHGAFFGAGAIVCSRLADKGHGAQAVAIMVGGMTVANVIGVPAATLLTNLFNWRICFAVVALAGFFAWLLMRLWLPGLAPLPDTGIRGQFRFLRKREPWLIYGGVFFGQASVYCWLSYIEPIMTRVTGFSTADMTWIMMLAGAGMVAGNYISGRLSDRYFAAATTAVLASMMTVVMPLIWLCAAMPLPSLILAFIATAGLFGIGGPLQYLIVRYSHSGEMLGGAGIQIAFNVSNAMSASLGGLVISAGFGLASPALIGAPLAAIGATCLWILHRDHSD